MPTCATSSSTSTACSIPRRTPITTPADRVGAAAWTAYGAAGRLVAPLAPAHLARRARRGKEDDRRAEKLGIASRPPFAVRPVWLHAVSVGESVAALALAEALVDDGRVVLMTTSTPAAAARVAAAEGTRLVHQYAPLDAPPFVARFLDHWRPAAALFTEGEVWPTTLARLARAGIPRAHVNARLSDRTFAAWRRRPWLARPLFGRIDLALAQGEAQAARFAALGARRAVATGNLKFDAAAPVADPAALSALAAAVAGRPVWLAASTHPGEEVAVVAAHRVVAAAVPEVVTILAPRHADRGAEVAALAAAAGPSARRSLGALPDAGGAEIYVADTMGEMGTLFGLADVVFLGGSFVPLGGHNPAEPAAFARPILTGPAYGEMFAPFLAAGAAAAVADGAALGAAVVRLLRDPAARATAGAAAAATLAAERGALARTLAALAAFLPRGG